MTAKKLFRSFLLLFTAMIWGLAFVAQSVGMDYVEPYTFNCVRSIIGAVTLLPVILIFGRNKKQNKRKKASNESVVIGGICCGLCLFGGMTLQQIGIQYTDAGKAGFITACYIVLVPVFSLFFLGRKSKASIWLGVILAVAGLYLLCVKGNFTIGKGDVYLLLCAIMFTFHILVIDYFNTKADPVKMSCVQFFVCGILSGVLMIMYESPDVDMILNAWKPILYTGVCSTGIGYTLQIVGQRGLNPAVASIILSMESVFSVLGGYFILDEALSSREMTGCILMFIAIILAQIPSEK